MYHCFLQRRIRHVEKAVRFRVVAVFYHTLVNHGVLRLCLRVFEDHVERSCKCLLRKSVAARPVGKLRYCNLRLGKNFCGAGSNNVRSTFNGCIVSAGRERFASDGTIGRNPNRRQFARAGSAELAIGSRAGSSRQDSS